MTDVAEEMIKEEENSDVTDLSSRCDLLEKGMDDGSVSL
jgi:hypothetical protein